MLTAIFSIDDDDTANAMEAQLAEPPCRTAPNWSCGFDRSGNRAFCFWGKALAFGCFVVCLYWVLV